MSNQNPLVPFAVGAFGFIMKYMAYGFLTPVVLMTFAALVFAQLVMVGPEIPFYEYFSSLIPAGRIETENIRIDESDIMTGYNLITLVIFLVAIVGKWLLRLLKRSYIRVFRPELEAESGGGNVPTSQTLFSNIKRRLIINGIVITAAYLVVFIAIPSTRMADGASPTSMYLVFGIFYVIAMVANVMYVGIDSLSDSVIGWAMAHRYG